MSKGFRGDFMEPTVVVVELFFIRVLKSSRLSRRNLEYGHVRFYQIPHVFWGQRYRWVARIEWMGRSKLAKVRVVINLKHH